MDPCELALAYKDVKRLFEYVRNLILGARGNVVSFSLKGVKKALGVRFRSEEAALRAALEALASLGLLQKAPRRKPRYLLQRSSPLWRALERGCAGLPAERASGRGRVL